MFCDQSVTTDYTVSCNVTIEVVKQTPYYYDLLWTYSNVNVSEDVVFGAPFRKELLSQNKCLKVIYRIDLNGVFVKLVNYSNLYEIFKKTLRAISMKTGLTEVDGDIVAVKKTMERRQSIEQIHFPDINLMHLPYSASYKRNNTYTQCIFQPQNLYMGVAVNGTEVIDHKEFDNSESLAISRQYYQDDTNHGKSENIFTEEFFDAYAQYHKLSSVDFEGGETFKIIKDNDSSWLKEMSYCRINKQDKYYRRRKIELMKR